MTTAASVEKAMQTLKEIWKPNAEPAKGASAAEIAVQRIALKRALERLDVIKLDCGHCQQFEMGTCSKHGEIPVEFQKVEGECPDWSYDGVPF